MEQSGDIKVNIDYTPKDGSICHIEILSKDLMRN